MLDSVYVGMSGLRTFSEGLRNISNNVSNLNSSGYKGTTLQFSDLFYKMDLAVSGQTSQSYFSQGSGVGIRHQGTNFAQGESRQTGLDTDLGITGEGFFVLRDDEGNQFYTRNGHFEFDSQGFLIDSSSKARVAGLTDANELVDINISARGVSPAKITTKVSLSGTLSKNDEDKIHTISEIPIFDVSGGKNMVKIVLTLATTLDRWNVSIQNAAGQELAPTGSEVRFEGDGSPSAGFNTVSFSITPTGGVAQAVTVDFGTPGTFGGVNNFSGGVKSDAAVKSQDGFAVGTLQKTTFDKNGVLKLEYSNGQKATDKAVALALFDDEQSLTRADGARFINETVVGPRISGAGIGGFGSIKGGTLEASNVDLAKEFSELIIIQRGYQSSSQVVSAANEMAQQMLELVKRR